MKKILLIGSLFLGLVLLPTFVDASWWNPFTWNIFTKKASVEIQTEQVPIVTIKPDLDAAISTTTIKIVPEKVETPNPQAPNVIPPPEKNIAPVVEVKIEATTSTTTTAPITTPPKVLTANEVYEEWNPHVVRVYCDILDSQGIKKSYSDGAGFLEKNPTTGKYFILTTSHVFTPNDIKADYCEVTFPENGEVYHVEKEKMSYSKSYPNYKGAIYLDNPSAYVKNLFTKLGDGNGEKYCIAVESEEQIMVLGYPIGSNKTKVSYSTGEILRYDQPFYISTAKIVSGYSGGIAVSLKNNCLIGIPVYSLKENLDHSMIFDINKY